MATLGTPLAEYRYLGGVTVARPSQIAVIEDADRYFRQVDHNLKHDPFGRNLAYGIICALLIIAIFALANLPPIVPPFSSGGSF